MLLGVPVTVVMPTVAPLAKVDKCRVSLYDNYHMFSSIDSCLPKRNPLSYITYILILDVIRAFEKNNLNTRNLEHA